MEERLGGRLLDTSKQILFQYGAGNLCLNIEELGSGWRSKMGANYQVRSGGNIAKEVGVENNQCQ